MYFLFSLHPLYILPEDIELDIDRTRYTESSDIGQAPCMWDERYCEEVISSSDDGETHAVQCHTSLLDDEVPILAIKIYPYKMRVITIANYLRYSSNCIHVPWDEVSVDTSLRSDASLDIEDITNFFVSKIGPRKALLHREESITLGCNIRKSHTDSIMSDTLSDGEWLIMEVILYDKIATLASDDTRCALDNSGEQRTGFKYK